MTRLHKTPGTARLAALVLGAVVAFSGQHADAASVTASGVTGGCANGIVTSGVGLIDVLAGGSWAAEFVDGDSAGNCNFNLRNTSSSAFAATITVITVDQDDDFGFRDTIIDISDPGDDPILVTVPGVSFFSDAPELTEFFFEGVGGTETKEIIIGRNSDMALDLFWGTPFFSTNSEDPKPRIAFSVSAVPVPLPAAGWLMIAGLGGLAALRRRKRAA